MEIGPPWAKYFLHRQGWSKRKGTTSKGKEPVDFPALKEGMLSKLENAAIQHNVPPCLIINWDQTAIHLVQCGQWIMNQSGENNINITGLDDKREIASLLAGSAQGDFSPAQLIFTGKL